MGIRDHLPGFIGGRPKQVIWTPEAEHDDSWTPSSRFPRCQQKGPIRAPRRNSEVPSPPGPQNRASRREYVRTTPRGNRRFVAGWGAWRSHDGRQRARARRAMGRHQTELEPRCMRRIEHAVQYRAHRKNRSTRITPR